MVSGHASDVITLLVPPGALVSGARVTLDEDEANHLRVRRASLEEPVRLIDGQGQVGTGMLHQAGKELTATIGRVDRIPRGPLITLGVAAGDKDRFLMMVEKAAELGASRIIPLTTQRSADVATRLRSAQLPKLQRRALEAIKQSGAAWAPEVTQPMSLHHFAYVHQGGARWLADATGAVPPGLPTDQAVTVAIGPEGGFTNDERSILVSNGFVPVRLGPHLLRFETAAIAALMAVWQAHQRASNE